MPSWPYGTRPQADAPAVVWIGEEVIRATLGDWAVPLSPLLRRYSFIPFPTAVVCAFDPPVEPPFTAADLLPLAFDPTGAGLGAHLVGKLVRIVQASVWDEYCEYIPAPDPIAEPAPPPVDYEPPPVPPGTELPPVALPLAGDPDLGAQMHDLISITARIWQLVTWMADNVTVRTKYPLPYFEISGQGQASHPAAIGFGIYVTLKPATLGKTPGAQPAFFDMGWVSWGTGVYRSPNIRLTREKQYLDTDGVVSETFSWDLPPGVEAVVTPMRVPEIEPPLQETG